MADVLNEMASIAPYTQPGAIDLVASVVDETFESENDGVSRIRLRKTAKRLDPLIVPSGDEESSLDDEER